MLNAFDYLRSGSEGEYHFQLDSDMISVVSSVTSEQWYSSFIVQDFISKICNDFLLLSKFYFGASESIIKSEAITRDGCPAVLSILKNLHFFTLKLDYSTGMPTLELADSLANYGDSFETIFRAINENDPNTKHSILSGFSEFSENPFFVFRYRQIFVETQKNSNDCGMHSILNGMLYALNLDPSQFTFSTYDSSRKNILRQYFHDCMINKKILKPNFLKVTGNGEKNIKFEAILAFNKNENTLSMLNQSGIDQILSHPQSNLNSCHFSRTVKISNVHLERENQYLLNKNNPAKQKCIFITDSNLPATSDKDVQNIKPSDPIKIIPESSKVQRPRRNLDSSSTLTGQQLPVKVEKHYISIGDREKIHKLRSEIIFSKGNKTPNFDSTRRWILRNPTEALELLQKSSASENIDEMQPISTGVPDSLKTPVDEITDYDFTTIDRKKIHEERVKLAISLGNKTPQYVSTQKWIKRNPLEAYKLMIKSNDKSVMNERPARAIRSSSDEPQPVKKSKYFKHDPVVVASIMTDRSCSARHARRLLAEGFEYINPRNRSLTGPDKNRASSQRRIFNLRLARSRKVKKTKIIKKNYNRKILDIKEYVGRFQKISHNWNDRHNLGLSEAARLVGLRIFLRNKNEFVDRPMSRARVNRVLAGEMITDHKNVKKTYRSACNGKNFDENKVDRSSARASWGRECPHCHALLLKCERPSLCCNNGHIKLEPLTVPTAEEAPEINELFTGSSPQAKKFRANAKILNRQFSMSCASHNNDPTISWPAFSVSGQFHHKQAGFLPINGQPEMFGQIYTMEPKAQQDLRVQNLNSCKGMPI